MCFNVCWLCLALSVIVCMFVCLLLFAVVIPVRGVRIHVEWCCLFRVVFVTLFVFASFDICVVFVMCVLRCLSLRCLIFVVFSCCVCCVVFVCVV